MDVVVVGSVFILFVLAVVAFAHTKRGKQFFVD